MPRQYLRLAGVKIWGFQFDAANRRHLLERGLTEDTVWSVWEMEPKAFRDLRYPPRSATHWMIGPDAGDKFWTIPMVLIDSTLALWRPITGWESEVREVKAWQDAT
jgi:hypothetical protein